MHTWQTAVPAEEKYKQYHEDNIAVLGIQLWVNDKDPDVLSLFDVSLCMVKNRSGSQRPHLRVELGRLAASFGWSY